MGQARGMAAAGDVQRRIAGHVEGGRKSRQRGSGGLGLAVEIDEARADLGRDRGGRGAGDDIDLLKDGRHLAMRRLFDVLLD